MVIWLIGMSGAGKTVIGKSLHQQLRQHSDKVLFLDGDIFRAILGDDLGHTLEDRRRNADRICRMCKYLDDSGIHVVTAILSIFPESREWNREHLSNYHEVFIDVSFEELKRRDSKGLYGKALAGEITNVVGVDIPFPAPEHPDQVISNEGDRAIEDIAKEVMEKVIHQID